MKREIIDVTASSYVIEMTGTADKLDAFVSALDKGVVIEVIRSGPRGMSRGDKGLHL
jgi:acetolactate synthase-1/3 small subunit